MVVIIHNKVRGRKSWTFETMLLCHTFYLYGCFFIYTGNLLSLQLKDAGANIIGINITNANIKDRGGYYY